MAVTISRPTIVDDSGSGTDGTIADAAWVDDFCDRIDDALADLLPLAGGALTGPVSMTHDLTVTTGWAIKLNTSNGSDAGGLTVTGGGAVDTARGAGIQYFGNEHASFPGSILIYAGDQVGGVVEVYTGAFALNTRFQRSGGVSIGTTTDPGDNNLLVAGTIESGGALTIGASGGNVVWGTYTPTLTGVTNVDSTTAAVCNYMRVGNQVIVSGTLGVDPTATTSTAVGISLPIASNFGATTDAAGVAAGGQLVNEPGLISADAANNRATLGFNANASASTYTYNFTFQYTVI